MEGVKREKWREKLRRGKGREKRAEGAGVGGGVCSMSPLSVIVLTGGSKPGLFCCHTQTHTHAHSTCVCLTDSSFITINQLQPPPVCLNPPTAGGKGGEKTEKGNQCGDKGGGRQGCCLKACIYVHLLFSWCMVILYTSVWLHMHLNVPCVCLPVHLCVCVFT